MKTKAAIWMMVLALPVCVTTARAQTNDSSEQSVAAPQGGSADRNVQAYVELLCSNVRQRKAEVLAEMMQLSAADAAKFWPLYDDYDRELAKLSDSKVANIEEYARTYNQMTNDKADELIHNALAYQRLRTDLITKYYDRFKGQLGAITAARFVQIEEQLLMIVDLQIDSALPIVGTSDSTVAAGTSAQGVLQ